MLTPRSVVARGACCGHALNTGQPCQRPGVTPTLSESEKRIGTAAGCGTSSLLEQVKGKRLFLVRDYLAHYSAGETAGAASRPADEVQEPHLEGSLLTFGASRRRSAPARVDNRICWHFGASTSSVQSSDMWPLGRDDRRTLDHSTIDGTLLPLVQGSIVSFGRGSPTFRHIPSLLVSPCGDF